MVLKNHANPRRATRRQGPVFIVGLSRSGTKLLRDLLNGHPTIRIPKHESHFIPTLLDAMEARHTRIDASARQDFLRRLRGTGFYVNMRNSGFPAPDEAILGMPEPRHWAEVIDLLFCHYLSIPDGAFRWGDKSPGHLSQLPVLLRHFPDARFLHIVRDPRDRAVSASNAWRANTLISCQQWTEGMIEAARFERRAARSYRRVRYEDLVQEPEQVMREVCHFLCVPFMPGLCSPAEAVENRGEPGNPTRQLAGIHAGNIGRYAAQLPPRQRRRAEAIVFPLAEQFGYCRSCDEQDHRPLSPLEWLLAAAGHYYWALRVFTRRWGMVSGLRLAWQRHRH